LHLRYTARSDGGITGAARGYYGSNPPRQRRLFSLRAELPAEWERFMIAPSDSTQPQRLSVPLVPAMFPCMPATRQIALTKVTFYARWNGKVPYTDGGALTVQVKPPVGDASTVALVGYPDSTQRNTGRGSVTANGLALGTWTLDAGKLAVSQIASPLRTSNRLDSTLQDIQLLCEYDLAPASA
jgi:hypothetical protein